MAGDRDRSKEVDKEKDLKGKRKSSSNPDDKNTDRRGSGKDADVATGNIVSNVHTSKVDSLNMSL